jgi:hypothetical protein
VQKIPTLFVRDPQDMSRVTREVTPGCEWVMAREGWATRKRDGTNVRVTVDSGVLVEVEKRRNPSRQEKSAGAEPGYVMANREDPSDQHIFASVDATYFKDWPDGSWPCEAVGPKIQGGAEGEHPFLLPFSLPGWAKEMRIPDGGPRDFDSLNAVLGESDWEGIVWHHPDGRMAKAKRRDFGHRWPSRVVVAP